MEHTPTPWEYSGNYEVWGIKNAITLEPVLRVRGDVMADKANAEFIVRACNNYDELIRLIDLLQHEYMEKIPENQWDMYLLDHAQKAIARAERKEV